MSGRGRDRFRREHPPRPEEKGHHGRSNPPSRHLWVGNISHSIDESTLARQFLRFGELESVAFQPGRSYAFVNFRNEDDAFAAIRELQGFSVAGNPLRIEFAKAEKSASRDDDYLQYRDEQRSTARASPFSQRDSRVRHSSIDAEKPRMSDKDGEPSEVLWIGFPAQLKVDEFILRKAFAPFGEIDKITAFPGRTYAFVRFRNVMAASRAKETLQGKLFGNPRVHICFAKSESGVSSRERNSLNAPSSPQFRGYRHPRSSEDFRNDSDFGNLSGDLSRSSPDYIPKESRDRNVTNFGRKSNVWARGDDAFEQRRFPELGSEVRMPGNMYEQRISPSRARIGHFREFSRRSPVDDDPFDLPEEPLLFHGAKKLKTSNFSPENELPEYPFTNSAQANQIPNHQMKSIQPYREKRDHRGVSYDSLQMGSVPLPAYPEPQRLTPESHLSSKKEEWKWEGTIAKGGTPICRARCFPVGKEMDVNLPEFLDCTARTSLDMLAKHYYQSTGFWVVFFVPASDPDMVFYNEFMTYLEEKQRAAVAKLDENNTLFLVPPSEFSEKVLKVPGRLSISGVVLRSEQAGSTCGSFHNQQEKKDPNFATLHGHASALRQASPPEAYPSVPTVPNFQRPGGGNMPVTANFPAGPSHASLARHAHPVGNFSEHEYAVHQQTTTMDPNWSPHDMQNLSSDARSTPSQAMNSTAQSIVQGYNPASTSRIGSQPLQERPPIVSSMPVAALQPDQLAQLATSLLGQQRQPGAAVSTGADWTQQKYTLPNNQVSSEVSSSQYAQTQQLQQQISNIPAAPQREFQLGSQVNQQPQYPEQEEGDTEKRLQATLQLAAALLQQIQQGKGT
ncbi:hypothetical protein M9H77_21454 [Catharanthus roseus]|uniref:Uncharacterized protein n=1 Tax=Catharanthus roseus TaxID=4058 RepID=A0ACC0ARN6_CATRO|nr:hypothetical protein M9H77_21454 [Catharanthus roseus]